MRWKINRGDEPMKKRTKLEQKRIWKKCIDEAKAHLKKRHDLKIQIAKLAIEACDIRHGGGEHWSDFKEIYTASKFADEIDVHRKTLYTWIEVETHIGDQFDLIQDKPWRVICDAARKISTSGIKSRSERAKVLKSFVYEETHRRRERLLMSYLSPLYKNLQDEKRLKFTQKEYKDAREMLIESLKMLDERMKPKRKRA